MYVTAYVLFLEFSDSMFVYWFKQNQLPNLFLLITSLILITAGGYIHNDIKDVKSDKINKPKKTLIGSQISIKSAKIAYYTLTLLGIAISLYLSINLKDSFLIFYHILISISLWFYSERLKKTYLIGNLLVAILIASVPLITTHFLKHTSNLIPNGSIYKTTSSLSSEGTFLTFLGIGLFVFIFLLNLSREIIKDILDIKGDQLIKARTMPIVSGIKKSKITSISILVIFLLTFVSTCAIIDFNLFCIPVVACIGITIAYLLKNNFKSASIFIKITMLCGLAYLIFQFKFI